MNSENRAPEENYRSASETAEMLAVGTGDVAKPKEVPAPSAKMEVQPTHVASPEAEAQAGQAAELATESPYLEN